VNNTDPTGHECQDWDSESQQCNYYYDDDTFIRSLPTSTPIYPTSTQTPTRNTPSSQPTYTPSATFTPSPTGTSTPPQAIIAASTPTPSMTPSATPPWMKTATNTPTPTLTYSFDNEMTSISRAVATNQAHITPIRDWGDQLNLPEESFLKKACDMTICGQQIPDNPIWQEPFPVPSGAGGWIGIKPLANYK
jgi:hypothetical protein